MNRSGLEEQPLVNEVGAIIANAREAPFQVMNTGQVASEPADTVGGGCVSIQTAKHGIAGDVDVPPTPLLRMIEEILEPAKVGRRTVKEWENLYRAFFAFFTPEGEADETERNAWRTAADRFNTDLVAICNHTAQFVPMTFRDFVEGVDSFRHDGLRERAHRDIVWQPKKVLLLMAVMIGRIVAGRQADAAVARGLLQELFPFRNYLVDENRKNGFLGSVFNYDPRFSILEYWAAGLKPLVHSFPQFANALTENHPYRCQYCASQVEGNPPLLQVSFRNPIRAPVPSRTISTLYFVLLHKPMGLTTGSSDSRRESSSFEFSKPALEALAFGPSEAQETKCEKIEKLFELAVTNGLLICAPQRAEASTAARIGKTLGRTQIEQFLIERFFALGFRNGHGNEPWQQQTAGEPSRLEPDKVKKAWKRFGHWKDTLLFFVKAGQPEAADMLGARIRHEVFQPKGSDLLLSLLNIPVYAPLMGVFLAADAQGKWLVEESDLHAFTRRLKAGAGRVLLETAGAIIRYADSLDDQETKGIFLFECAVGVLLSATDAHQSARRLATLKGVKDALRQSYERLYDVSLSTAPSVLRTNPAESAARVLATKKSFEEAEQMMMSLLAEPLKRKVSEQLRAALAALPTQTNDLAEQPVPRIHLENQTTFEESISGLGAWIRSTRNQVPSDSLPCASQLLAVLVELRAQAEEGNAEVALEKAAVHYPTLCEKKKQALAPFFCELCRLVLRVIEQQLDLGNEGKATALAASAMPIIEITSSRDEFKSLLQNLFAPKTAKEAIVPVGPSTTASATEAQGLRTHQAEVILREYADELSMAENRLEREFLEAVRARSEADFKRKEKLRNRLQRQTRWGGREPYKTTLKLLESVTE